MHDASKTALASVFGAFIGAVGAVAAQYVNLLKPSEAQVISSGQYKQLVDESASKAVQVGRLAYELSIANRQLEAAKLEILELKRSIPAGAGTERRSDGASVATPAVPSAPAPSAAVANALARVEERIGAKDLPGAFRAADEIQNPEQRVAALRRVGCASAAANDRQMLINVLTLLRSKSEMAGANLEEFLRRFFLMPEDLAHARLKALLGSCP